MRSMAHFTALISKHFFPAGNDAVALIATFGIFAVGFLMRPIGAVFFGYIGDKYGRKNALALSILMMAFPTAAIGLLPTYSSIGIWAPIILTIIRLVQGVCHRWRVWRLNSLYGRTLNREEQKLRG